MRLATVIIDGDEVGAVVSDDGSFVPLSSIAGVPTNVLELLDAGLDAPARERLAAGAASVRERIAADAVRYGPLYRRPHKIIGIGLNYREHASDLSAEFPESPASFLKGDHTLIGPGDDIVIPAQSARTTAEAELAIVIGRECWQVDTNDALDYVAGVIPVLDQTAEDILALNPRFLTRAKNFPTFLSLGAPLVTIDEVFDIFGDLASIRVATKLNGQLVRDNVVANMAFAPDYLVSFHSKVMPLYPGDVICTGTPGAVVISPGDIAGCDIPGIGGLTNTVVASPYGPSDGAH